MGLALAQSDLTEKRKILLAFPIKPVALSLLAKTYLAKMNSDYTEMERISKQPSSPALVHLDMLAYLLLQNPDFATPELAHTIVQTAGEYGPSPRVMNLNAMLLLSDVLAKHMPIKDRIEGTIGLCKAALEMDPWYYHAHMTIAGLMHSSKRFPQAAEHYEKALLLNPVCIEALDGLAALSKIPERQPPKSSFLIDVDMNNLLAQMSVVKNSDLEIDFQQVPDVFVHGFCNVNHGGKQPRKFDLLRQQKSELAIEYLDHLNK